MTTVPDDATQRIPPRYWWLKRILAAVGVLIVLLVLFRLWWGWEAQRRLDAKIAQYRAAGQPVTMEDFQQPPVPDAENAAKYLQDAAAAIVVPAGPIVDIGDLCGDLKLLEQIAPEAKKLIEANQTALNLARQARLKSKIDWKAPVFTPSSASAFPLMSPQRELARLLGATATYQHHVGDDEAAIKTLRDMYAQADAVRRIGDSLIGELVGLANDGLASVTLEAITPGLRLGVATGAAQVEPGGHAAEEARALLATLLDERRVREAWARSMYAERLCALDLAGMAGKGGSAGAMFGAMVGTTLGPFGFLLRPMFQADALFMMDYFTALAAAGSGANFATAQQRMPRYPSFSSGIERNVHLFSRIEIPSMGRALELHFRSVVMRRMAAIALALRLYDVEHGRWPERLEELAPDYLPALPGDPFAPNERPIGYRPDAPKPVLYSVGSDGIDDGGEYELTKFGGIDWNAKDLVFFLNGDRPNPRARSATQPSTTQAVEGEGEVIGDGGKADENQPAADQP